MNAKQLSNAVRANADTVLSHKSTQEEKQDTVELLRVLARIVDGMPIQRAFGAPGDWGYGTPIGDAINAA